MRRGIIKPNVFPRVNTLCEEIFGPPDERLKPGVDMPHNLSFNGGMNKSTKYHEDAKLIDALGGSSKLARRLNFDMPHGAQRVQNWKYRGIPEVLRLRRQDVFGPAPEESRYAR